MLMRLKLYSLNFCIGIWKIGSFIFLPLKAIKNTFSEFKNSHKIVTNGVTSLFDVPKAIALYTKLLLVSFLYSYNKVKLAHEIRVSELNRKQEAQPFDRLIDKIYISYNQLKYEGGPSRLLDIIKSKDGSHTIKGRCIHVG